MDNNQSKFVQGLINAWHIVEFGVICVVCSIPIFTAGAAATAMFRMHFNARQGKPVSFTGYFDEFGNCFRNSTLIMLIQLASGILIGCMAFITFKASAISSAGIMLLAPVSLLFLIWILVFAYAYAHEAYFALDVKTTIKNCFSMTFGCLLSTTALLVLLLILPMLYFLMPEFFIALIPVWVVLLIPLINWWDSYFYLKAFEDYDKEDKQEDSQATEVSDLAANPEKAASDEATPESDSL